ncbi:MAG: hypothetical protein ACE5DL_06430, partial [Nitrosopumilaceae archaeon]
VLDNGYEGVMVWDLGKDTRDKNSLLTSIDKIFRNSILPETVKSKIPSPTVSNSIQFGSIYFEFDSPSTGNNNSKTT